MAGRTDTGVHAFANVVSVEVGGGPPAERSMEALNAVLPSDVAVVRAEEVAPEFHARHSARSRSYRYRIWRRRERSPFEVDRSMWHPRPLDLQRLQAMAAMVVGEHDFRAFTPTETQHKDFVRTIEDARWLDRGDAVELEITANAFLRHMVQDARRLDARARSERVPAAPPGRSPFGSRHDRARVRPLPRERRLPGRLESFGSPGAVATIGRVRFPVVLFDLDGTVVDSGRIILASMRHATRTVLGREIPDEALMATVGGPGLEAQMLEFGGAEHLEELVTVYRAHNEPLHEELELFTGMDDVLHPPEGRGTEARARLGQAPLDGRAGVRRDGDRASVRRRRRRRRGRRGRSRRRTRCCWRSSGSARRRIDAVYVGDSPFDMGAAKAGGLYGDRRHLGRRPRPRALAEADEIVDTPGELLAVL